MPLGRSYAGHDLKYKLSMAAKYGLEGIEIFYEDLVGHAESDSAADLLAAAQSIRDVCTELGLEIICLQPFMHYEGLLDRQRHSERIKEIKLWMALSHILKTDLILVPSSFLSRDKISSDIDLIVSDFREIADLGLQQTPPIRFMYESLCWGTYIDKWEACWDIVQRVDRSNFGICLDTFNILGRIFADPESDTGRTPQAEQEVEESVARLVEQIKPHKEKVFFVQVVSAERLEQPLRPGHPFYSTEQPARMSWSRNCRLFYGETEYGSYLPVRQLLHAIIHLIGYDGWVSAELFNRVMNKRDHEVVEELAGRAAIAWEKMVSELDLKKITSDRNQRADSRMSRRMSTVGSIQEVEVARL